MILPAQKIMESNLVNPCCEKTVVHGVSYGLSPAGYDIRLDDINCPLKVYRDNKIIKENVIGWNIHPGNFVLASAMEEFNMPNDVMGIVHDKSSLARLGLAVQNTVIEPGWRGYLTLELTNHSGNIITLKRGCGIAQVVFHRLEESTIYPYSGKYQDQAPGPQPAIHEK